MSKVIADISMSLDGFVAGPNDSVEDPIGVGGERLHDWMLDERSERDAEFIEEFRTSGAYVMGVGSSTSEKSRGGTVLPFTALSS